MIDAAQARAHKIAALGGLSDTKCCWKDCEQKALLGKAICFDHAYPDFDRLIARQDPNWYKVSESDDFDRVPEQVCSAEDAMLLLGFAAKRWNRPVVVGDCYRPQDERPDFDRWDSRLARFVTRNPGKLESLLDEVSWQERLAYTCMDGGADLLRDGRLLMGLPRSILSNLLSSPSPARGEFLWRPMRAFDAGRIMRFAILSSSTFKTVLQFGSRSSQELSTALARWLGVDRYASVAADLTQVASPECLDALKCCAIADGRGETPVTRSESLLPALVPDTEEEIIDLGSDEISVRLAQYRGMTNQDMHDMLVRGRFIAKHEKVGDVIVGDARILLDMKVSRHELAKALRDACQFGRLGESDRLQALDDRGPGRKWGRAVSQEKFKPGRTRCRVELRSTFGHHQDPLHSFDTYCISSEVGGSADCAVSSRKGTITFSDMHPYLIRRACFFEGSVNYRLDPEKACRVLGLV